MPSATQFITQGLRDIGCLRPGQSTSTDVLNEGLTCLNNMIESWLLDRLMVPNERADIYTLVAGQQQYTIGPSGANFTAARPTRISQANVILNTSSPSVYKPLEIIDRSEWGSIRVRVLPLAIPLKLYYDRDFDPTSGYATINLWPGPLTSYQLELFTWEQLQSFANLSTVYNFPPGYALAIRKNLGVEMAPMMKVYFKIEAPLLELVMKQAVDAKAAIQSYNTPESKLYCDPMYQGSSRGGFNYMSGERK